MAFDKEPTRTANDIGRIEITLSDNPRADPNESQGVAYIVDIHFSDGSVIQRRGDLWPHLTTAQKNTIANFMANMRTKAVNEFLP